MNTLKAVFFLFCIAGFNACGLEKFLPGEDEIPGWTLHDKTGCFNGHAQDCTSLYEVIDGGADKYLDRGFVSGIFRGYVDNDGNEICVELYDHKNAHNADLVYSAFDESDYVIYGDIGDKARLDPSFLSDYVFEMIQDGYFMRLRCPKDDSYKGEMIKIVKLIENNVKSSPIINLRNRKKTFKNIRISIEKKYNTGYQFKFKMPIDFSDNENSPVINIYNSKGTLVRKPEFKKLDSEYLVEWDGKNSTSIPVSQGLYTISMQYSRFSANKKFLVH